MCEMCDEQMRNDTSESLAVTDRADSMLTFDLRAFARNYAGTPFGSRCKTAADELDRLYEVERLYSALTAQTTRSATAPVAREDGDASK